MKNTRHGADKFAVESDFFSLVTKFPSTASVSEQNVHRGAGADAQKSGLLHQFFHSSQVIREM
jgi:hypothetical protein